MTDDNKLDHILNLLTGFIAKQEAFNSKQEAFNSKQEAFNSKQEAFNSKQEGTNSRLEGGIEALRLELGEFRHQEELQHNATHRLIMQAFDHINALKVDKDVKPWER